MTKALTKVCIYLVHSSLQPHTEQAYYPKPERKRIKEKAMITQRL